MRHFNPLLMSDSLSPPPTPAHLSRPRLSCLVVPEVRAAVNRLFTLSPVVKLTSVSLKYCIQS